MSCAAKPRGHFRTDSNAHPIYMCVFGRNWPSFEGFKRDFASKGLKIEIDVKLRRCDANKLWHFCLYMTKALPRNNID